MKEIIICKHCGKPEYYGEMRWLNGICMCRNCYKSYYEVYYNESYKYNDLDETHYPTLDEYNKQKD